VTIIDARSRTIYELVDHDSQLERVASGFVFIEGPVWHPVDQRLLFSDIPGDVRYAYTPGAGVAHVKNFNYKGNGMTYDSDLNLLVCEHSTSSVVREYPDGRRQHIAREYDGEELNSPNDVCVRSDGSIYFTDPWYGRFPDFGHPRRRRLGWQGVFRIPPGGTERELELLVPPDEFEMPNGLCFAPDESLLYVNDSVRAHIKVWDVNADGSLSNGRMFLEHIGTGDEETGIPDGMKCDQQGNIWVTGPGGVWIISAEADHLGTIGVPEIAGNLTWGGGDWRTLYIVATSSLYSVRTKIAPRLEPYMSVNRALERKPLSTVSP
jgi:gluconolactonase